MRRWIGWDTIDQFMNPSTRSAEELLNEYDLVFLPGKAQISMIFLLATTLPQNRQANELAVRSASPLNLKYRDRADFANLGTHKTYHLSEILLSLNVFREAYLG